MIAKFDVCLFYNDTLVDCNSQLTLRVPGTGKEDVEPCMPTEDLIYVTQFNPGKDIRLLPVNISTKRVCKIVPGYEAGGTRYTNKTIIKKVPVTYFEREYRNLTRNRNITKTYEAPYVETGTMHRTLWEDMMLRYEENKGEPMLARFSHLLSRK
jgi:hypothetical protein